MALEAQIGKLLSQNLPMNQNQYVWLCDNDIIVDDEKRADGDTSSSDRLFRNFVINWNNWYHFNASRESIGSAKKKILNKYTAANPTT